MRIDRQDLIEKFAALSDEELRDRLAAGTLTEVAEETARAELASRGLPVPASAAQESGEPDQQLGAEGPVDNAPPADGIDLVTLLRTNDVFKANVLRMHLESEGIFAYLWGEHLGVAHLIFSAATGGMRLQVRNDQLQRAHEVLAAFERGDYALEEGEQPE